jgi:SAM-dependent methyltransferase
MTELDENQTAETTKQFAGRMIETIDNAAATMLISIGHQTGLFEAMVRLSSTTSAGLADAAGLNERYVREWLGGMVTARIVDYDPTAGPSGTYTLPPHRAAVLTRAAAERNMAVVAQYVPLMAEVEQGIIGCFRNGGGLPYSEFPRFHAMAAEQSALAFDVALIDMVLPLVDGLPERLRLGADGADFGCGSGHAVNLMAQAFPASRFTGLDFSEEAIAAGTAEAFRLANANSTFTQADLTQLDVVSAYDLITAFDTIHDQAHPARVLANIFRALRPGGIFLMADIRASSRLEDNIELPMSTYMYAVSTMHCMTVSLAYDGDGLGTAWGRQLAVEMLTDAGFSDVRVEEIDRDPRNYYYIARK